MLNSYGLMPNFKSKTKIEDDIKVLNLPSRITKALRNKKIHTIKKLIAVGATKVSKDRAISPTSLEHIKRVLSAHDQYWQTQFIKIK